MFNLKYPLYQYLTGATITALHLELNLTEQSPSVFIRTENLGFFYHLRAPLAPFHKIWVGFGVTRGVCLAPLLQLGGVLVFPDILIDICVYMFSRQYDVSQSNLPQVDFFYSFILNTAQGCNVRN